jgi:glutamine synthetase
VQNVAHSYGKTATFMPKPLVGDNGNGMHVHQSLSKGGKNIFHRRCSTVACPKPRCTTSAVFSKHAKALNALTNASTNSYKRLVKGFEAPTLLAYSARNRSASVRIPYIANPKATPHRGALPRQHGQPVLAFTAMLMAGLDGIQNKIHPGEAMDKDLYDLPPEEEAAIRTVSFSLDEALDALDKPTATS